MDNNIIFYLIVFLFKWIRNFEEIKISKLHQPFKAQEDTGVPFHRNFNSILRRGLQKISYECRAYESVDEKSLS